MTTYRNQPLVAHSTVTVAAAAAAAASAAASASSSSSSSSSSSMIGGRSLRRTAFQRSTHASMEIDGVASLSSSISGEEEEEKKLMMHVSMDNLYNEENKQSILHDSLRFLRLRNPFNHPLTSACFTPVIHSLTSLHVDSKAFNHPIERGVLPLSLLHLHLPSSYSNQFSVAQCLHLQSITFDPSDDFSPPFHSDILADDLPSSGSLRTLKMPFKWRGRFLPSLADPVFRNIISLDIGCGYDYQLPFLLLTTPFHHLTSLSANFAGFVPDVIFYAEHTFDSLASVAHFLSQFIGKDVCVRYTGNSISNECIQQETYSTVINRRGDTTVKVTFVMAHFDMRYIINHDPE